jgi:predicted XRE-type DNA-binding protein
MSDDFELVRGSGNVFRDFDMPNPDLEQLRAILAAQIIKALNRKRLTVRKAAELTGIAAADFSRIRNANIGRFTVDRLMTVLGRLDQRVDVNVKVRPNVKRTIPVSSPPGITPSKVSIGTGTEPPIGVQKEPPNSWHNVALTS